MLKLSSTTNNTEAETTANNSEHFQEKNNIELEQTAAAVWTCLLWHTLNPRGKSGKAT